VKEAADLKKALKPWRGTRSHEGTRGNSLYATGRESINEGGDEGAESTPLLSQIAQGQKMYGRSACGSCPLVITLEL